jgi:hypothetical protein
MSQNWNLQDIRPAEPRRPRPRTSNGLDLGSPEKAPVVSTEREDIPSIIIENGTKKGRHNTLIALVLFVVIIGGALLLSALLGKTELTIYPEFRQPNVNSEFTAYPDMRADSLGYEVMTLEATAESQVKASGQIEVKELATGIIEIKKSTPGTERLIKNTRFRSPDGKVFRIEESVVVPGSVKDESGANVPGSIQAKVFADDVGEAYNSPAGTKFDVPGFEEGGYTDLYNAIYATNPEPFTGGFNGPQFQIDDNELATARQALQVKLRNDLLLRVEAEKPSGFITFTGAVAITYNQLPAVEYGTDLVTIKEQAVLQIPLFKADKFGQFLAAESVATYSGGPVRVQNPSELEFLYSSATTSSSVIANEPSLTFTLKGKPQLIWEYDAEKLKKDLAGLPKTAINNAISAYPGIEGARVSITPFWKRTFPQNPDKIIITEELKESE